MQNFLRMPALINVDREGTYTYYQYADYWRVGWYHEKDAKVCCQCSSISLTEDPRAESKEESDRRSRELGLW